MCMQDYKSLRAAIVLTTLWLTHTQTHTQTAFNRYIITSARRARNCVQRETSTLTSILALKVKGQYSRSNMPSSI